MSSTTDNLLEQRFGKHFEASAQAKRETFTASLPQLVSAAQALALALGGGHKILACGNGGSAGDAQHFAAELTGRFERERRSLAGIALTTDTSALTAIANDYSFERVFSKQVEALAQNGDWLLAISTSGNSGNVIKAIEAMHDAGGHVLALTGKDGGRIASLLDADDLELRVASSVTARIQEVHLLLLHCLCDGIDELLFPSG